MGGPDALSPAELRCARAAVAELVIRRRRGRELVPAEYEALLRRLDGILTAGGSVDGTGETSGARQSKWLDVLEAAALIGCSPRWVRRIAPELGGRRVGGRWIFPRNEVEEHARGRDRIAAARR